MIEADWTSLLPPFMALLVAVVTRSIFPALFIGIWTGAWLTVGGGFSNIAISFVNVFDQNIVDALYDRNRLMVICFTLMIGGFIATFGQWWHARDIKCGQRIYQFTEKWSGRDV